MKAGGQCIGHHVHEGVVVRCMLRTGHPMPHAAELLPLEPGQRPEMVKWDHDRDHWAAEVQAARWRRERGGGQNAS